VLEMKQMDGNHAETCLFQEAQIFQSDFQ
jgi:hypothetical protein